MPNSRVQPLTEKASTPATPMTENQLGANEGESTKDNGVEAVRSHHFGANVIKGAGALDGLVRGHFVDFARNGGNERVRIAFGAHKQAKSEFTHS